MQEQNPSVHSMCVRRTHILMDCPDAAQSQYLLGLKTRALMISPPGRVYRCFPSLRSHSIALPSYRGQTELNTHTQTHSSKLKLKLLSKKKQKKKKKNLHISHKKWMKQFLFLSSTRVLPLAQHSLLLTGHRGIRTSIGPTHLSPGSTERPVRGHSHTVEEAIVSKMISLELTVSEVPYLQEKMDVT